ncbi:MAG: hypothetical protein ACYDHW_15120 [Syntrophorhabdaceae bacterium]
MRARILSICIIMAFVLLPGFCPAQSRPDLAVTDITVDAQCYVYITVKNLTSTPLPPQAMDQGYGVHVAVQHNGVAAGGWSLTIATPQPGNVFFLRNGRINGTVNYTATINTNNTYVDGNLNNNSLTKTLTCKQVFADPSITGVDFTADCRPIIRLKNLGDGPMTDQDYYATYLNRIMDGVPAGQLRMGAINPAGAMRSPQGAMEYIEGKECLPKSTLRYQLVTPKDTNVNNNTFGVNVPDRCKAGAVKRITPPTKSPIQSPAPTAPIKVVPRVSGG